MKSWVSHCILNNWFYKRSKRRVKDGYVVKSNES